MADLMEYRRAVAQKYTDFSVHNIDDRWISDVR